MDSPDKDTKKIETNKISEREKNILAFWEAKNIFKKSIDKDAPKGEFVFYDGPPFATGLPHFGHVLPTSIKDAIPRFKTMQGFRVRRRWGWDCHGLPVENIVEKELGLKARKDIEAYGIGKFNEAARKEVLRYADDWKKIIPRLGRWVDMEDDYRTMDPHYTESVWWAFKTLYDKKLAYEGFKAMQLCPRCETTLSNFEVSQGYKDISDISVYVKFKIKDERFKQTGETYFLAWTTTPWTLPGNVALAVGSHISYSLVQSEGLSYILASEKVKKLFEGKVVTTIKEMKGSELVGLSYEPVFPYYKNDSKLKNRENGWKVYAADFVKTDEGTGIVHIAPAFGEDDLALGTKHSLPFVQHVKTDGTFKPEVTDFAGLHVKPKSEDEKTRLSTDILVLKYLQDHGAFFSKEKITHSYPHCWRCDTPLLNFASASWFVKVTDFKETLLSENKKISWTPDEIGSGRFGKWLSVARDWAISRSRFWGAPIPVWKCNECEHVEALGSVEDIKKRYKKKNNYFVMRHGETDTNVKGVMSSRPLEPHHLTERGREQVRVAAEGLFDKKIDMVFVSPFLRTQETAAIVREVLRLPESVFIEDKRLEEIKVGIFDGKSITEYKASFSSEEERFFKAPLGGEDFNTTKKRLGDFLYDIENRFEGKNILIVTHESPSWLLFSAALGHTPKESVAFRKQKEHLFLENAEVRELDFTPLPHNEFYELDFHRPYIDAVTFSCDVCNKGTMRRVKEVFDCWFESGSMPFAEMHYPHSDKGVFNPKSSLFQKSKGYPADFIAEGLDQTRGWFYSMLVLGVALFNKAPYKSVVVNGIILAEDGQKMSKRFKNYPDLLGTVDRYGADALRLSLLSSSAVRAQDFCFSERGVDDVMKKLFGRLENVLSFYLLYAHALKEKETLSESSPHVLDRWVMARLFETTKEITESLESYVLDRAGRALFAFVDDLSVWYLRRSRDRFKGDDEIDKTRALRTTRFVLSEFAKLLAPFAPFFAEYLYLSLGSPAKESVHLESWPDRRDSRFKIQDSRISEKMAEVRRVVSLGLELRAKAGVKVRQPLSKLTLKPSTVTLSQDLLSLIRDEMNVKEVVFDKEAKEACILDVVITPALKEEGDIREFIRTVQELRKAKGLTISDMAVLVVDADGKGRTFVEKNTSFITKTALLKGISFTPLEIPEVKVGDYTFKLSVKK